MDDKVPNTILSETVIVDAPLSPTFKFLANLKMRPWIEHGIDWKLEKVTPTALDHDNPYTTSHWTLEINGEIFELDFKILVFNPETEITLSTLDNSLIIKHLLNIDKEGGTQVTIQKEYYVPLKDHVGETHRLSTLADNLRVLLRKKKKE